MNQYKQPEIYVITSVSFGDKPAGAIATLALQKTARLCENEYPKAIETYVDDSCKR